MAIYKMLKTVSFSPEDIERLATAYEDALRALRVVNRADPITVVIAKRIIDAAQTGMRDSKELCALAIKDLQTPGIHSEKGAR
jgi:integrase